MRVRLRPRPMSFLHSMKRGLRAFTPERRYTVLLVPERSGGSVQRFSFRLSTAVTGLRVLIVGSATWMAQQEVRSIRQQSKTR